MATDTRLLHQGICYSGYREDQSPDDGFFPTPAQIEEDLRILSRRWRYLRLYDTGPHAELVLSAIDRLGLDLEVLLGAWLAAEVNNPGCPWGAWYTPAHLAENARENDRQVDQLIALARRYPRIVTSVAVGNEATVDWTGHLVPVERVIELVRRARAALSLPITFCENHVPWMGKLDALVPELDFLSIHTYPVWEFQTVADGLAVTQADVARVQERHPGVPVVITEAGWTTRSNGRGIAPDNAGTEQQARYYEDLTRWGEQTGLRVYVFEAFDEPWKGSPDPDEPEKHWGLFTVDRRPKPVMLPYYADLAAETAPHARAPHGTLLRDPQGHEFWEVEHIDALRPFLVSLISPADVWAFVSTAGGLTAGRVDASRALFPYETDDRLHHAAGVTGPITLLRVGEELWQPFDPRGVAPGRTRRLRKAAEGHWLELEEHAPDLGLTFRMRWTSSPRFGLVRRCTLEGTATAVELLDGLLNLIPADVPALAQQGLSALVDAYKRNELLDGGVALYAMDARLSDQAAPAEALRANVVWRIGLDDAQTVLTAAAVDDMRAGRPSPQRDLWFGQRGAYLVRAVVHPAQGPVSWDLLGEVHLDHVGVVELLERVAGLDDVRAALDADLEDAARRLRHNIASADGLQLTADRSATVHHFANVVFNNMRGGVFAHDYDVSVGDLLDFLRTRNAPVAARHYQALDDLGARLSHPALLEFAASTRDPQLQRLCMEYLPLVFSRRHGDPSRPWNAFSIKLRHPDGSPLYSYEGNWRDIFQNWEALCRSYPAFLVPIIAKFVNASTVDGFNPYRITREGVDWECPDPEDPWANIGYWGDHQIVYLFRLLESAEDHTPGALQALLGERRFSFADVPYRIKPYEDLVQDAKDTIEFDWEAHEASERRAASLGTDGRLVLDDAGAPRLVTLFEKLLITVLAKLSNLVVDGGIWLNTQRPEWNDANNALVGAGLSMVTLAQLRRAVAFLHDLLDPEASYAVSPEVAAWLEAVSATLQDATAVQHAAGAPVSPATRRALLDALGQAFSAYRAQVYSHGLSAPEPLSARAARDLCARSLVWLDHSLQTNRRPDGLVHSYNLLRLTSGEAHVGHLYEMLEGQVAVLGSGVLSASEAVATLDALFASRLYREDQHSFLLYPFRDRPRFLSRNVVPVERVRSTPLLAALAHAGDDSIVAEDDRGTWRFHADFANAGDLRAALDALEQDPAWADAVAAGRQGALDAYEATFDHHSFTGRSGTMYKYEGLGSIYWHMVSKLLVSVQECWRAAADLDPDSAETEALAQHYYRVRRGLSFNKSVAEYGAIPTDPYSHTPWHLGAQQPGMTGQVKEEILTRMGELGVWVRGGQLTLDPALLRARELTQAPRTWSVVGVGGEPRSIEVPAGAVAFTLAQVPVVLQVAGDAAQTHVVTRDQGTLTLDGAALSAALTQSLLARDGRVRSLHVTVPRGWLRLD